MNMEKVYSAKTRLQNYLPITPIVFSHLLQRTCKKPVWLKLETQLPTGSFKPRPAFNNILSHLESAKKQGVVASSSGNFAQAVAYASRELGINAVIVMTEKTSPYKIARTKALGAEVVLCGNTNQDRVAMTQKIQQESGRLLLHPFDAEETIAGDATIGLELSEQLKEKMDDDMTVLVPVSGGGLISGIAFALKNLHPTCKIIGIQPENNGSFANSFKAGKRMPSRAIPSLADALGSPLGELTFKIIEEYVDDAVQVTEDEIRYATQFLIEEHKLVVEPGGAAPVAALLAEKISAKNIICITSGGNISLKI